MRLGWFTTAKSFSLTILLHVLVIFLLIFSFDSNTKPTTPPRNEANIVEAVVVDKKQVEIELERIKQAEIAKQKAETDRSNALKQQEQKLIEAKQKTKAASEQRRREQEQIAKIKQQQQTEEKRLEKIEREKHKAELGKQIVLEEIQKAEAEQKRKNREDEMRKQIAVEEAQKAETERKRKQQEKAMLAALAVESAARQASEDEKLKAKIKNDIYRRVVSNFNRTGLPSGLTTEIKVKLIPGGEVVNASISSSSGNNIFDQRAITAVKKASPLPVPNDHKKFERLGLREIIFNFSPEE